MHEANTGLCLQVFETHGRTMEFALEVNGILGRAQERVVQQQSTAIEAWLEAARNEWQALADATDPLDFFYLQADVAADLSERVLVAVQELIDIQLQAKNDILQCLQQTLPSDSLASSG